MIKLLNVSKTFGQKETKITALNKINLTINSGEFVVLLGPSGSGKSTLLNILSGLDAIDQGQIFYDQEEISKFNQKQLTNFRKEKIGFIFQAYFLLPNISVQDNIELGANLTKQKNYQKLIDQLGLTEQLHKYPYQLSGGQQQRVSIARALSKKPQVLFCDEPTGALDEKTGKEVLKALQTLNSQNKTTVVVVTHNPGIAKMADHVIHMNSGQIIEQYRNEEKVTADNVKWA